MSKREDVTKALIDLLTEQLPEVSWNEQLTGAVRGQELQGTVSCDRISFEWNAKNVRMATASYSIYLIDANSLDGVDALADKIDNVLCENWHLGGIATNSAVKSIIFGAAQGKANAGMALVEFDVLFTC